MDLMDKAQERDAEFTGRALEEQLAKRPPAQQVVDGEVLCIDCDEPVGAVRLAALPNACRCLDCQRLAERRTQPWGHC